MCNFELLHVYVHVAVGLVHEGHLATGSADLHLIVHGFAPVEVRFEDAFGSFEALEGVLVPIYARKKLRQRQIGVNELGIS